MQDAHLAETQQSLRPINPEHQERQRQDQQMEKGETSITMSMAKLDGGTSESHGGTRKQHLHLKLRSGRLRNGKRVGARGSLHQLRNGGDFGFLENSRKSTVCVDRAPTHNTHLCSTVCSQARKHRTRLGSVIFVRLKRV